MFSALVPFPPRNCSWDHLTKTCMRPTGHITYFVLRHTSISDIYARRTHDKPKVSVSRCQNVLLRGVDMPEALSRSYAFGILTWFACSCSNYLTPAMHVYLGPVLLYLTRSPTSSLGKVLIRLAQTYTPIYPPHRFLRCLSYVLPPTPSTDIGLLPHWLLVQFCPHSHQQ